MNPDPCNSDTVVLDLNFFPFIDVQTKQWLHGKTSAACLWFELSRNTSTSYKGSTDISMNTTPKWHNSILRCLQRCKQTHRYQKIKSAVLVGSSMCSNRRILCAHVCLSFASMAFTIFTVNQEKTRTKESRLLRILEGQAASQYEFKTPPYHMFCLSRSLARF